MFVRHPGYAGSLLFYLAIPVILDSRRAIIPSLIGASLVILRTALEDRTLLEELPGYRDYARTVRYRLFPGLF